VSFDTTYHMYDTELQSKSISTRNCELRMDGTEATLPKQKAAALMFDNMCMIASLHGEPYRQFMQEQSA